MNASIFNRLLGITLAATFLCWTPGLHATDDQVSTSYEAVVDFLELPEDFDFGQVPGVAVNSKGHLIVSHRGPKPVLVFDTVGKLLNAFGDEHLPAAHATRVDREDNIWISDINNHIVIKYSHEGEVLMMLGEPGEPGDDESHFNRPTDVAFAPNGDFFVSDGYGNSRVVKFSKDGQFLTSWGMPGGHTGQFHLPHGVAIDAEGLLHVADRENDRMQVFDQDGNFIRLYGGFAPFGFFIAEDQTAYVAEGRADKVLRMTLEGKKLAEWGSTGAEPGQLQLPHGITVANDGTVYVTEITGKRIQKFVPSDR